MPYSLSAVSESPGIFSHQYSQLRGLSSRGGSKNLGTRRFNCHNIHCTRRRRVAPCIRDWHKPKHEAINSYAGAGRTSARRVPIDVAAGSSTVRRITVSLTSLCSARASDALRKLACWVGEVNGVALRVRIPVPSARTHRTSARHWVRRIEPPHPHGIVSLIRIILRARISRVYPNAHLTVRLLEFAGIPSWLSRTTPVLSQ